jgi:hypothetical protein
MSSPLVSGSDLEEKEESDINLSPIISEQAQSSSDSVSEDAGEGNNYNPVEQPNLGNFPPRVKLIRRRPFRKTPAFQLGECDEMHDVKKNDLGKGVYMAYGEVVLINENIPRDFA